MVASLDKVSHACKRVGITTFLKTFNLVSSLIILPDISTKSFKYSLYKKKRKHYIIFNNLRTFEDEHFKLTGDLDWHVLYQLDECHNFSCTITSHFPSSCKGTHESKSHKNSI